MKTINLLTKEEQEITSKELIISNKKTKDYIVSIPHSGLLIPVEFKDKFNLGRSLLIGTDLFTNQVYNVDQGNHLIFNLNPYLVNVSRSKKNEQLINKSTLPKHLQTDPFHLNSLTGEIILKEEFSKIEKEKLLNFYDQYHQLIQQAILEMKQEHGFALIFDCHSMNSMGLQNTPDPGKVRPDFVIGSLNETSADKRIISCFYETLKTEVGKFGLTANKDNPYSGGYITQKYHDPKNQIYILQLEVKKALYMDESLESGNFEMDLTKLQQINSVIAKSFQATSQEAKRINPKQL